MNAHTEIELHPLNIDSEMQTREMRPEKNSWTEHKWQYNSWQDAVTTDFHYQEHRVKGLLYWLAQRRLLLVLTMAKLCTRSSCSLWTFVSLRKLNQLVWYK